MADPNFLVAGTNPFGLANVGSYAAPVLADIDGDGDLDGFIGNGAGGNTLFFRNTGSATAPTFSAVGANPFGLAGVTYRSAPELKDIDGDGDLDALIGNTNGNTFFFRNTGSSSAPTFSLAGTNPFGLANVGSFATPTLADMDGDGDLDALIGSFNGNTVFFRNTGSSSAPTFSLAGTNPFGLVNMGANSAPTLVDVDGDGDLDALIGNDSGNTFFFRNTGSSSAPTFSLAGTNPFGLAGVGTRSNPTLADVDGDGDLDALIGNYTGNTVFFRHVPPAPAAPTGLDLTAASDGGASNSDDITNVTTPVITGTVAESATIILYDGANAVGTATSSGAWSITSAALSDGAHTLTAVAIGEGGPSTASSPLVVSVYTTAPVLSSAEVRDATVQLTYTHTLDGASDPAASAYTVTVGGSPVTVGSVDASGKTVTLTLASPVSRADAVTLDYTVPGSSPVRNPFGDSAAALSGQAVTNRTALIPNFTLLGDNAFGLANVGAYAAPALVDIDGDGDLDAFIGSSNRSTYLGGTVFFRNTGTTSAPTFSLVGANRFGLTSVDGDPNDDYTGGYASPTLVDIDGDGDRDAFIGNYWGQTAFFRNTGTTLAPTFSLVGEDPLGLANVGYCAAPEFKDIDDDGDLDAFIGNRSGNTAFFRNTGSTTAPTFSRESDNPFGLAGVGGYAAPALVDVDGDGDLDALIGKQNGETAFFRNTGSASAPTFSLEGTNPFGLAGLGGYFATPALADVDGDGDLDALIGKEGGSTAVFLNAPLVAPRVPTGLDLTTASDSGSSSTDNLTSAATPTITGTVGAAATVVLYDGATAVGTATASGAGAWTITSASLGDGAHTLTARASHSGVTSSASSTLTVTIDTTSPVLSTSVPADDATGVAIGADLVLTFSEAVQAGTTAPYVALYQTANDTTPVETFDLSTGTGSAGGTATLSGGSTLTLTHANLASGTAHYVQIAATALRDAGGNLYAGIADKTTFNFTTAAAPSTPESTASSESPNSTSSTVDGVTLTQTSTTASDGSRTEVLSIPVVTSARQEQDTTSGNADIPLARDTAGTAVLQAQVPIGVGMQVETTSTTAQGLQGLIAAIQSRTAANPTDQTSMTGVGSTFLAALPQAADLTVRTITPMVASGSTAAPDQPIIITGKTNTTIGSSQEEAIVLDARQLPSGTIIQLQNVEFAAIVGAVRVSGGDGSQMVVGDSANQWIVLGADDDTLRGGGGDDYIGSAGGNDVLSGDDGNDTVRGGDDNDTCLGGANDDVLLGNVGADVLLGNMGADTLFGGRGDDRLFGGRDADTLLGNDDADTLEGDDGADLLLGNTGSDLLLGNLGADTLFGGVGSDTLFGGRGDDLLFGDSGDDRLWGDAGDDTLSGGAGADAFVYGEGLPAGLGDGHDVITDFNAAEGDRIRLRNGLGYTVRSTGAGDAVIVFSNDDDVTLTGVTAAQVNTAWFVTL